MRGIALAILTAAFIYDSKEGRLPDLLLILLFMATIACVLAGV